MTNTPPEFGERANQPARPKQPPSKFTTVIAGIILLMFLGAILVPLGVWLWRGALGMW